MAVREKLRKQDYGLAGLVANLAMASGSYRDLRIMEFTADSEAIVLLKSDIHPKKHLKQYI